MKKDSKRWSITRVVGRFTLTISQGYGISKGGYFHIPFIYLGFGRDGFLLQLLGIGFGLKW